MQGIFAEAKDIQKLFGCSYSTARRYYRTVKDAYEKKNHQKVTITELCDYLGITRKEFDQHMIY